MKILKQGHLGWIRYVCPSNSCECEFLYNSKDIIHFEKKEPNGDIRIRYLLKCPCCNLTINLDTFVITK